MSDEKDARRQVAVANRLLAEFGLAAGVTMSLGHVSMRVPDNPDTFWVKGRGYEVDALALMRPEDMVLCDLDGNLLEAAQGVSQCSEVKIHSCLYKARPDVLSVVHVHPRYAVLLSVLGTDMVPVCREGMPLVGQPIPVYPDVALITTEEEGVAVAGDVGVRTRGPAAWSRSRRRWRLTFRIRNDDAPVGGAGKDEFPGALNCGPGLPEDSGGTDCA